MKIILSVLLLAFTVNGFSQLTPQEKLAYSQKVSSYKNMKSTGGMLAVMGLLGGGGGAYLIKQGNTNLNSLDADKMSMGTSQLTAGYCLVGVGATFFITGIILSSVGGNKARQYQERLDLGIIIDKNQNGVMLVYRF